MITQVTGRIQVLITNMTRRQNMLVSKLCQMWHHTLAGNNSETDPAVNTHMKSLLSFIWSYIQTTRIQPTDLCGRLLELSPEEARVINDRARGGNSLSLIDPVWPSLFSHRGDWSGSLPRGDSVSPRGDKVVRRGRHEWTEGLGGSFRRVLFHAAEKRSSLSHLCFMIHSAFHKYS